MRGRSSLSGLHQLLLCYRRTNLLRNCPADHHECPHESSHQMVRPFLSNISLTSAIPRNSPLHDFQHHRNFNWHDCPSSLRGGPSSSCHRQKPILKFADIRVYMDICSSSHDSDLVQGKSPNSCQSLLWECPFGWKLLSIDKITL